jgi:hypothetical protein
LGYTEFGRFCKERLHVGKSTVNRSINIAEVYKAVASTGAKTLPTSERQLRPLLCLRQSEDESSVWSETVAKVWEKAVHDAEITKKPLTQKSVILARHQLGLDPHPKDSKPEPDLEKLWTHLESCLWHEREFWPIEHRVASASMRGP